MTVITIKYQRNNTNLKAPDGVFPSEDEVAIYRRVYDTLVEQQRAEMRRLGGKKSFVNAQGQVAEDGRYRPYLKADPKSEVRTAYAEWLEVSTKRAIAMEEAMATSIGKEPVPFLSSHREVAIQARDTPSALRRAAEVYEGLLECHGPLHVAIELNAQVQLDSELMFEAPMVQTHADEPA